MSLSEALSFLESIGKFRIKLSLDRIKKLTEDFGNPQNYFPSIHVAGTNGKGSVCTFLAEILQNTGKKVGLYTSPHLIDIRERIKIGGEMIGEEDFVSLLWKIRDKIRNFPDEDSPTYFEILTCLSFLYFNKEKIDLGIFEVGLGGRFDATNVIKPVISVITNISQDHTEYLGKRIGEIAFEKAGIIKEGVPVCFGGKSFVAWKKIKGIADERKAPAFWLYDGTYEIKRIISSDKMGFYIKSPKEDYEVFPRLTAYFQAENLAISILASELLRERGFEIKKEDIIKGIENAKMEGRFEIIDGKPRIIADGAHNPDAIRKLLISLKELKIHSFVLLYASMKDKDIEKVSKILFPHAKKIVLTKVEETRGEDPENIIKRSKIKKNFIVVKDFHGAFEIANSLCSSSDVLLVTGSLYLIGALKKVLKGAK